MKKRRAFFQILLSYLVIMLIPLIALGSVLFNFFFSRYSDEILANRLGQLSTFQMVFDGQISSMNAHSYRMLNSEIFSTQYYLDAYGNFYNLIAQLSEVNYTNDFINGAFFINSEIDRIFTSSNQYSYENFRKFRSGYPAENDDLESFLIGNERNFWIPLTREDENSSTRDFLTYVVTNKRSQNSGDAAVFYQIRKDTIDPLAGNLDTINSNLIIGSPNGEILYLSDWELPDGVWEAWQNSENKLHREPVQLQIDGKPYVFYQIASEKAAITYTTIIPYQSIVEEMAVTKRTFYIGIIGVALVCTVFISYFMKVNYTPIRSLEKLASSLFRDSKKEENEFETAKRALIQMNKQNVDFMHGDITLRLMRGAFQSLDDLEEKSAPVGFPLMGPEFRVILFRVESDSHIDIETYQQIANIMEERLRIYADASAVNYSEDRSIFLLISGVEKELRGLGEKYIQLKNVIESTFSLYLSIGVGNIKTIDIIPESVDEAVAACNYNFVKGKSSITFYDEIEKGKSVLPEYPKHTLEALYAAIIRGEEERVAFTMNTLTRHISDTKSLFYDTCLVYDILNTAIKASRELNCPFPAAKEFLPAETSRLSSIDEIVSIVKRITKAVVKILSENPSRSLSYEKIEPESQFDQISSFILENFCDENFSVKLVADHFSMSISNFSHYFKNQTGQMVSEYIALLRFEKATRLLRDTDMNLQDIARHCGYLHLSTFMRQFKQKSGTTPASYRKNYRHQEN